MSKESEFQCFLDTLQKTSPEFQAKAISLGRQLDAKNISLDAPRLKTMDDMIAVMGEEFITEFTAFIKVFERLPDLKEEVSNDSK